MGAEKTLYDTQQAVEKYGLSLSAGAPLHSCILLQRDPIYLGKSGIRRLRTPYPAIDKHSYWCWPLIDERGRAREIEDRFEASDALWAPVLDEAIVVADGPGESLNDIIGRASVSDMSVQASEC